MYDTKIEINALLKCVPKFQTYVLSKFSSKTGLGDGDYTKMQMNRTKRFRIFLSKKALILIQEGKEYLYSDVVRIHES